MFIISSNISIISMIKLLHILKMSKNRQVSFTPTSSLLFLVLRWASVVILLLCCMFSIKTNTQIMWLSKDTQMENTWQHYMKALVAHFKSSSKTRYAQNKAKTNQVLDIWMCKKISGKIILFFAFHWYDATIRLRIKCWDKNEIIIKENRRESACVCLYLYATCNPYVHMNKNACNNISLEKFINNHRKDRLQFLILLILISY